MRVHPSLLLAATLLSFSVPAPAELSDQEILALMNRVTQRIYRGDLKALDDLKTLKRQDAMAYLYNQVLQNKDATWPGAHALAKRAAEVITEFDGYDEQFALVLQSEPGEPGVRYKTREKAIYTLLYINNKASVRVFCSALSDPKVNPRTAADVSKCLALLNVPGGALSKAQWRESESPAGIEKWKTWWSQNSEKYK